MRQDGFTLIEMVIAMAIMALLLGIATLSFNSMVKNGVVDSQMKGLSADLMSVRSQAMYEKRGRTVMVSATGFSVYYSDAMATPLQIKVLPAPVNPAALQVDFDEWGGATLNNDSSITEGAICVQGTNGAGIDSIVISRSRIQMGKLKGAGCTSANIDVK